MTRRKGSAEGRSAPAERPSCRSPPCRPLRAPLRPSRAGGGTRAPPAREARCRPPVGRCRGVGAGAAEGNPEVRFLSGIKAGGQVRPRLDHTAPQRGAVQGLSDCPLRGGHIGASGLTSGVRSCAKSRRKPISAGLITGISASKSQNTPALARASKHAVAC